METVPIKAIKILTEANALLYGAFNSNEQAFVYIDENTKREYTQEESDTLKKYNMENIVSSFSQLTTKKDALQYLNKNVEKEDRSMILTELIAKGVYDESSLGIIKSKKLFLFTPECKCCGKKLESEYHSEAPLKSYPYSNKKCPHCSHDEAAAICKCDCCLSKWEKAAAKFSEFEPYFIDGYSIVSKVNQYGFEISSLEDVYIFIDLIKDEKFYPSNILFIRNIDRKKLFTLDSDNVHEGGMHE